jgi:hypothetical protein
MPVEHTVIAPPRCRMGAISDEERARIRAGSPVGAKYDTAVNRESAAEVLAKRAEEIAVEAKAPQAKDDDGGRSLGQVARDAIFGTGRRQGMIETMGKQAARNVGNQISRQIVRGIMGVFGGKR